MRFSRLLGCLVYSGLLFAGTPNPEANVNTRYKVESVVVSGNGWSTDFASRPDPRFGNVQYQNKVSPGLRKRISALIGDSLDFEALNDISRQLRKEFHAATVTHRVLRGAHPEYVKVVFQVGEKNRRFDVAVPKFLYDSKEGWTGAIEGVATVKQNAFALGLISDGDTLAERYAGVRARYENTHIGTDRVRLQFDFDSYHAQWNDNTLAAYEPELAAGAPLTGLAANTSGPYRTRQNFEPTVTFVLAAPLTITVGASFERFQEQYPTPHTEAANAVVSAVRYGRNFESAEADQNLEADYSLRAGSRVFDSDFVYAQHRWGFRYTLTHGRHELSDEVTAGIVTGTAPLYERFVLGNSSTLRGWNKFDLDPLGGNRMVHNSVEYRYGVFDVFYDTGAVWEAGQQPATPRHGIGVGLRQGVFALAVAFPVRSGRADPIFMMGMLY